MKITKDVLISLGFKGNEKGNVFTNYWSEKSRLSSKLQLLLKNLNDDQWELKMSHSDCASDVVIELPISSGALLYLPAYVRDVEDIFDVIADRFMSVGEIRKTEEIKKVLCI